MRVQLCRHTRTNGTQCKSPMLDGSSYCFFHDRLHARHKNYRTTRTTARGLIPGHDIQLHALEDAESVQVAISAVVNALAMGMIEGNRAKALLYGLQLASINITRMSPAPKPQEVVREVSTTDDGLHLAWDDAHVEIPEKNKLEWREPLALDKPQRETESLPSSAKLLNH